MLSATTIGLQERSSIRSFSPFHARAEASPLGPESVIAGFPRSPSAFPLGLGTAPGAKGATGLHAAHRRSQESTEIWLVKEHIGKSRYIV